jgi:hypothetical protein
VDQVPPFQGVRERPCHARGIRVHQGRVPLLTDYYAWWRRSKALLDGEGFNGETQALAERMLESWRGDKDPESLVYWMVRNIGLHPRHRHLAERMVAEHLDAEAPAEGPAAPGP